MNVLRLKSTSPSNTHPMKLTSEPKRVAMVCRPSSLSFRADTRPSKTQLTNTISPLMVTSASGVALSPAPAELRSRSPSMCLPVTSTLLPFASFFSMLPAVTPPEANASGSLAHDNARSVASEATNMFLSRIASSPYLPILARKRSRVTMNRSCIALPMTVSPSLASISNVSLRPSCAVRVAHTLMVAPMADGRR